jgi:hypothetical protein
MSENTRLDVVEKCRRAARARWEGHERAEYRTIRLRAEALAALEAMPGATWSEKVLNATQSEKKG